MSVAISYNAPLTACVVEWGFYGNSVWSGATAEQDNQIAYNGNQVGDYGSNVLQKSYHFTIRPSSSAIDLTGVFPDNMEGWHVVATKNFNISGWNGENECHWCNDLVPDENSVSSNSNRLKNTEHDPFVGEYKYLFNNMNYIPFNSGGCPGTNNMRLFTREKVEQFGDQMHPSSYPTGYYSTWQYSSRPHAYFDHSNYWPGNVGLLNAFGASCDTCVPGTAWSNAEANELTEAIQAYNNTYGHGTLDASYYENQPEITSTLQINDEVSHLNNSRSRWPWPFKEALLVDTKGTVSGLGTQGELGNDVLVIGILDERSQAVLNYQQYNHKFDIDGSAVFVVDHSASHRSLKENIRQVGKSPKGFNIYNFNYKNKKKYGSATYQGVIYDEIPEYARGFNRFGERVAVMSELDVEFKNITHEEKKK